MSTLSVVIDADASLAVKAFDATSRAAKRLEQETKRAAKAAKRFGLDVAGHFKSTASGAEIAAGAIKSIPTAFAAATVAATAYSVVIASKFQVAMADLEAVTGAAGDNLLYLSNEAQRMGSSTTLSAAQAAEAFKLIASAKPDLLDNVQALSRVTAEVVKLSEASGVDLAFAANTVGGALNQFGAASSQAARFVNVLAASSRFGSSAVEQTSEALANSGTAAHGAGLSFEETAAAIQSMAAINLKGSEAGTALTTALTIMTTKAKDEFNPQIVGFTQAVKNLGSAQLTAREKIKLFGADGAKAADALTIAGKATEDGSTKFEKLTEKITGTNSATEQAIIRNNTLEGDLKGLNSAVEGAANSFGKLFIPILRTITTKLTELAGGLQLFIDRMSGAKTQLNLAMELDDLNAKLSKQKSIMDSFNPSKNWVSVAFGSTSQTEMLNAKRQTTQLEVMIARVNEQRNKLINPSGAPTATIAEEAEKQVFNTDKPIDEKKAAREKERLKRERERKKKREESDAASLASENAQKLESTASFFDSLEVMRENQQATERERIQLDLERTLSDMQVRRQMLIDDNLMTQELENGFTQAKIDAALVASDKIRKIKKDEVKEEVKQQTTLEKFISSIRKKDVDGAVRSGVSLVNAAASAGQAIFGESKKVKLGLAIINGFSAIQGAASIGFPQNVPGVIMETARMATTLAGIRGASSGGGGSAPTISTPSMAVPPPPKPPQAEQKQSSQGIKLVVNAGFLDTDINDTQLARFADKLAIPIQDSFNRGLNMGV